MNTVRQLFIEFLPLIAVALLIAGAVLFSWAANYALEALFPSLRKSGKERR